MPVGCSFSIHSPASFASSISVSLSPSPFYVCALLKVLFHPYGDVLEVSSRWGSSHVSTAAAAASAEAVWNGSKERVEVENVAIFVASEYDAVSSLWRMGRTNERNVMAHYWNYAHIR